MKYVNLRSDGIPSHDGEEADMVLLVSELYIQGNQIAHET